MNGWMDGQIERLMNGWIDDRQIDKQMNRDDVWMQDRQLNRKTDKQGWMDGWMDDKQRDRWMIDDRQLNR